MQSNRIDISAPLPVIAKYIAEMYLLRPFPSSINNKTKLLDYSEIRKTPIDKKWLYRPIHGYQNASRVAGLIEALFYFYQKHILELPFHLQNEIKNMSFDRLKKIQIVGLMRATGRTKDSGHGSDFNQQGELECLQFLEDLGIRNKDERKELASAIVDADGGKSPGKMPLASCLLYDATVIETFRDGVAYSEKALPLKAFAFFRSIRYHAKKLYQNKDAINPETVNEFIDICCMDLEIIKAHQGYLCSAVQDGHGNPIVEYWPKLTDKDYLKNNRQAIITQQMQLEYNDACFEICFAAVQEGMRLLNQPPYPFEQLIHDFFGIINQLNINLIEPINISDRFRFTNLYFQFFEPRLGKRVSYNAHGQLYQLRINWDFLFNFFVTEINIKPELLSPINIFKESVPVKESDQSYLINFPSEELAQHYLILTKLFLHHKHFFTLSKVFVIEQKLSNKILYQFKLNSDQFNLLAQVFSETNIYIANLKNIKNINFDFPQREAMRRSFREAAPVSPLLKSTQPFAIKTVSANERCFMFRLFEELKYPDKNRDKKRHEPKKHLAVEGKKIFTRSTAFPSNIGLYSPKESQYSQEIQAQYTKAQSMTLCLPDRGFFPPVFSFTEDKAIGIIVWDFLPPKLMQVTAGWTRKRPHHHFDHDSAVDYMTKRIDLEFGRDEFEDFKNAVIAKGNKNTNEMLARIRIGSFENEEKEFSFFINSDNLPSRILAKQFAMALHAGDKEFKVYFYTPDQPHLLLKEYTNQEYLLDCNEARQLFENDTLTQAEFAKNNFEFLLVLNPIEIQKAFSLIVDGNPLAIHILKEGYIHIFRLLMKNAGINLDLILGDFLNKGIKKNIDLLLLILHNALLSKDHNLAEYIFNKITPVLSLLNQKIDLPKSPLLIAVESNFSDWVEKLLAYNCFDLEMKNKDGYTALNYAALHGYAKCVDLLLKKGANPNETDKHGNTSLIQAAYYGHADVVKLILKTKTDINAKNQSGYNALASALVNKQENVIRELVFYYMKNDLRSLYLSIESLEIHYRHPIFNAAIEYQPLNIGIIKACVNSPAIFQLYDSNGLAPLHRIIIKLLNTHSDEECESYLSLLSIILKQDISSDIRSQTRNGETIFSLCKAALSSQPSKVKKIDKILIQYVLDHFDSELFLELKKVGYEFEINLDRETLCKAIEKHPVNFKEIEFLLQQGASPNTLNKNGLSPLHLAAYHADSERLLYTFLPKTPDINLRDGRNGSTPLHHAIKHCNYPAIDLLLRNHADLFCKNDNGLTPLHFIMEKNNTPLSQFFAKKFNESIITLTQFLSDCDSNQIKISPDFMAELVGYSSGSYAKKIVDNCIQVHQSSNDNEAKEFAWKTLCSISNYERKNDKHNSADRTNLSAYFRTKPKSFWTIGEIHRGDEGSPLHTACEYYEKVCIAIDHSKSIKTNSPR